MSTSSTTWLVDTNNLTGYAQVVEERYSSVSPTASSITRTFTYGTQLISVARSLNSQPSTFNYFSFDGHGNIRELTDSTGTVTDRYDYDAFGNLVFKSGSTTNNYLYCGEQYDPDLGLYYLRARYMNADSGRFWSMDDYEGSSRDPLTLHRYNYCIDPIGSRDPSGNISVGEILTVVGISSALGAIAVPAVNYAMGEPITLTSIASGAAYGAGFGLAALASPAVAAGLAIGGAVSSAIVLGPILFDSNFSHGQRFTAAAVIAASLWGAQSGLKYAKAQSLKIQRAEQVRINAANGKGGDIDFAAYIQMAGMKIIGRQVYFKTPFGIRIVDYLVQNPETGEISGVEVKSSVGAFDRNDAAAQQQAAADRWINENGATSIGKQKGIYLENTIKLVWPPPSSS